MASIGYTKYGMADYQPLHPDQSAAANGIVTSANNHTGSMNAENPFVWVLGVFGVVIGLVAFSTHVRVGPVSAGVDAGTT